MRCYGSSLFLKNKFGVGYHLTLVHRKATKFSVLFLIWKFHACSLVLRSEGADVSALRRLVRTHVTGARQARYPLYKQANAMFAELILYFLPPFPQTKAVREGALLRPPPGPGRQVGCRGFFHGVFPGILNCFSSEMLECTTVHVLLKRYCQSFERILWNWTYVERPR